MTPLLKVDVLRLCSRDVVTGKVYFRVEVATIRSYRACLLSPKKSEGEMDF
jgi:hypothetical protein